MGLIGKILGIGNSAEKIGSAVERVVEVFVPNRTKIEDYVYKHRQASLEQLAAEYKLHSNGWFDQFVNGLNRLPRPILALSTVGLFGYAMKDPIGFSHRMNGLDAIPDPLWWLLGAIVSFYFGARELHYSRQRRPIGFIKPHALVPNQDPDIRSNAALDEWHRLNK